MEGQPVWREVARIVLHENYTILTGRDVEQSSGIFSDFEMDTWRIDGDNVDSFLRLFGLRASVGDEYGGGVEINRIPSHNGNTYGAIGKMHCTDNPKRIDARIVAPQLLELRVTWNDDPNTFVQEVTYCDTFTVEWWAE